jgi:hypothetical protein
VGGGERERERERAREEEEEEEEEEVVVGRGRGSQHEVAKPRALASTAPTIVRPKHAILELFELLLKITDSTSISCKKIRRRKSPAVADRSQVAPAFFISCRTASNDPN